MAQTVDHNPVLSAFERIRSGLRTMATRLTGDADDADDALQEAFVRLWVRREKIETADEAAALMTTTVKHLSIDTLRRRRAATTVSLDEERDGTPDSDETELQAAAEERYRDVQLLISSRLTPVQQTILRMRDYEERHYDDIAAALGMQLPAVRMQLSRARQTIREAYRTQCLNKHTS